MDIKPEIKEILCNACGKQSGIPDKNTGEIPEHTYCRLVGPDLSKQEQLVQGYENSRKGPTLWAWDTESMLVPTTLAALQREHLYGNSLDTRITEPDSETITVHEHRVNYLYMEQLFGNHSEEFSGTHTLRDFILLLKSARCPIQDNSIFRQGSKHVFIAHNSRGYDSRLLYDAIRKTTVLRDFADIIPMFQGAKLFKLTLTFPNKTQICFMDSLSHIAKSLRQIPAIFALDTRNLSKGEFPYLFNTPTNQAYIGQLPSLDCYDIHQMSPSRKAEVERWYAAEAERYSDGSWNLQHQLKQYCKQDVRVLKTCMEAYYRFGYELTSLNPFLCSTIASYALKTYLTQDMPDQTLFVLNPHPTVFSRSCLRGGRTDVRCRYRKYSPSDVAAGRYACYYDVQSLYPYVQIAKPMPVGVPVIMQWSEGVDPGVAANGMSQTFPDEIPVSFDMSLLPEEFDDWFIGFVEFDYDVTGYLHHPVLVGVDPFTNKLVADLKPKNRYKCTSIELFTALKTGCYKVTKVYEIHRYKYSYDLFKNYIRRFLKIKVEASGMPSPNISWEEFHQRHIDELGIHLEKQGMTFNKALKEVAKLFLNSLWGKFGQRPKVKGCDLTSDPRDLAHFEGLRAQGYVETVEKYIWHQEEDGEPILELVYDYEDSRELSQRSSVPVAAYVSAWGRIVLWEQLNKLGERVLYHDTDSVIFEHSSHGYNIPEGWFLGEWENETPGKVIVEFVGVAPKTYGYITTSLSDGTIHPPVIKCKGFSLNSKNQEAIDFNAYIDIVQGKSPGVSVMESRFVWNQHWRVLYSLLLKKFLSGTYHKAHTDPITYCTYPFGGDVFRPDLYN
jgi:hypothetical protein